ncbi:hypothetical protein GCM10009710_24320 [Aeromicrobium alkaliterrae]|uniref:LPXTG cell wall anchor domain-containing protein n=1 Tax=Aeromicrobium alkaliterrae TaxID=302168 RepID=A0ABP4W2A1_9ACTN
MASAAEPITDGNIYGWGFQGAYDPIVPWTSNFPNTDAPFVDVAVDGLSGGNHTTVGVTSAGKIVTQGNYQSVVSLIPASLRTKDVTAVEIYNGRAAAVTRIGEVVTWANAPAAPAAYRNPAAPTGVVDVQLGGGSSSVPFGIVLKEDGTIDSWGPAGFVANMPNLDDVVQIDASVGQGVALTSDGELHFWGEQLGDSNIQNDTEVRAATVVEVALGTDVGYALTDDGKVLTFGGARVPVPEALQYPVAEAGEKVVALGSNNGRGYLGQVALKESGAFVAWGLDAATNALLKPPAVDLEGHQVVAFETDVSTHSALIFGPADPEPEPGVVDRPKVEGFPVVGTSVTGTPATFNFNTTSETSAWYRAPAADTPAAEWTLIGETNPLELTAAIEGQYVAYRTTVEDADGVTYTADSDLIGPIDSAPTGVVEAAKIEGVPVLNSEVVGIAAQFSFTPETESSAWYRADSADAAPEDYELVSEANPLTLSAENEGKYLLFRTTVTDEDGATVTSDSAPIGPVVLFSSGPSSITGDLIVGSTLTGVPGEFSYPPSSVNYAWLIGPRYVAIPPGGAPEITLLPEDVGQMVRFFAQSNVAGQNSTSFSDFVGPVTMPPLSAVEVPQVEGVPVLNSDVVGIPAVFNRTPESESSAWYRADSADAAPEDWELVTDANPLTLGAENEGKFLVYRTTAIDEAGATVTSDSAVLGPVVQFSATPGTITGDLFVGSTVTGVPGEFSYPPDSVIYAFLIGSRYVAIPNGGAPEVTLLPEDLGQTVRFFATGNVAGQFANSSADSSGPVTMPPLVITGQPTVTGQPFIGQTLTATPVAAPDGTESTLQWFAGTGDTFTAIEGATGTTLELTEAQRDQQVKVVQTVKRTIDEETVTAESVPTSAVTDAPVDLVVETEASLSGAPRVGQTLTGTPATYSTTEDVTITNYWVIGGVETVADGTTLVLTADHVGQNIQFKSVATRGEESVPSTSTAVGPVLVVLAATAPPTIAGTPQVGKTLVGTPATFNDTQGVTVANQWFADGEAIEGATGANLVLTADQLDAEITFVSTATRGTETPVVSESVATAPVAPEDTAPPTGDVVIDLDGPTAPGATISVQVGTAFAGQQVQVYLSNLDRVLGTFTVAEDGTIQVKVPGDIPLGTHRLAVYAGGSLVGWDDFAVTILRPEDPAFKDLITVTPNPVKAGDQVTIQISGDRAGDSVRVVLFSTPRDLGFVTVAADGTVRITIPADVAAGVHRVAVYDADGNLIGWQDVTVTGDGAAGSGNGRGLLPSTGLGDIGPMVPLGLTFLLAGLGLLVYRSRGRQQLG